VSDPFETLHSILDDFAKGRGLDRPLSSPMEKRINSLVKEGMRYWAYLDDDASFEWTREDISNYTPIRVVALLDEIRKIWADDMLSWMEANAIARDHSEDEHDMRWR
jgi:hypothetical protein